MLRSIKSGQRKMRVIALKIDGEAPSSFELADVLDFRQVTLNGATVTLKVPFAQLPIVLGPAYVSSKGSITVTGIGDILIVGSDTEETY